MYGFQVSYYRKKPHLVVLITTRGSHPVPHPKAPGSFFKRLEFLDADQVNYTASNHITFYKFRASNNQSMCDGRVKLMSTLQFSFETVNLQT